MRIFELAQVLKTTGGDVLRAARALDLEAHSTLSRLDDDDIRMLKHHFATRSSTAVQADQAVQTRLAAKQARAAEKLRGHTEAERQKLDAAITRARAIDAAIHPRRAGTGSKPVVPVAPPPPPSAPALDPEAGPPAAETVVRAAEDAVITPDALTIEPLPPLADQEAKVVIHAETAALEPDEKSAATEDKRVPAEEEVDPDEELASAYLGGRRAQLSAPAKAHAMRPKETRDVDLPRAPAAKGTRTPAGAPAGRSAPAATVAKERAPDASRKRDRHAAAPAPAGRAAPDQPTSRSGIIRGQQPIIRGQPPITRGTAPARPAAPAAPKPRFAPVVATAAAGDKTLQLRGPVLVKDLAEMMGIRPNRLIADLMQLNVLVSINQRVDLERAGKIAAKYGYTVEQERTRRSSSRKPAIRRLDAEDDIPDDQPDDMKPRPPVVTFLGHVDHGKTSLMDRIRQTQVVAGEAGGITQHIGAYTVELAGRKITFLDTPGHAAFSAMRARGANLTDIAVIIIAADDGIMPQTREVIKQAQQAEVQIMVAINKCDLPAAKPERVRQQLQAEGLTPEEWGGDLVVCDVSAATGKGLEHLLEMILLQADMLELQANPSRRADGYVIEAQLELGLGPTASLLVASGTLKLGDVVLIGEHFGRLRGLMDDRGRKVLSAGPATAVRVMGLSGVPEPGAEFRVMVNEKRARELAEQFATERKSAELSAVNRTVTMDNLFDKLSAQKKKQLGVIIKGDTQGSIEAIVDSLRDIRSEKITLDIVNTGIGNVTTNDVQRAAASDAVLLGFQVGLDTGVASLARHDKVRVHTFRIIYELFDYVKQAMLDLIAPEYREVVKGHAQIRAIFDIGKMGRIAGCQLLDGVVNTKARVRIKRVRDVIFDGRIASLRHFQNEVNEVRDLQECGIFFEGFEAFEAGDIVECYVMEEMERTL